MAGYFHRLAAHAPPSGPRVRPVASPYVHSLLQDREDAALLSEIEVPKAPRVGARSSSGDEIALSGERRARPNLVESPSSAGKENTSTSLRNVVVTVHPTRAAVPEPSSDDVSVSSIREAPVDDGSARPMPQRTPDAARVEPFPHPPQQSQARESTPAPSPGPGRARPRPEARPGRTDHSGSAVTRVRDARTPDSHDLPDVHIHIGRIELTAVVPPTPRQPHASRPTLPLDEYLRRRDGKPR
jgi:hypothetical protein